MRVSPYPSTVIDSPVVHLVWGNLDPARKEWARFWAPAIVLDLSAPTACKPSYADLCSIQVRERVGSIYRSIHSDLLTNCTDQAKLAGLGAVVVKMAISLPMATARSTAGASKESGTSRARSAYPCATPSTLRSGAPRLLTLIHMSAACHSHRPTVGPAMLAHRTSAYVGLGRGLRSSSHPRGVPTAATRASLSSAPLPSGGSDNSYMSPEDAEHWKVLMETIDE